MIQGLLKHRLHANWPGVDFDVLVPPDQKLGDYSTNLAFALAKQEKEKPADVADEIIAFVKNDPVLKPLFHRVELAPPGFINFFLAPSFLQSHLTEIYRKRATYGASPMGRGKTVIVEYSSPNIAKPMHVGHLRSTIIGDALANIYHELGYRVIRWNYLGDWGTQFGKLIAAYKRWGEKARVEQEPIKELLALYVRFHEELKSNPDLEKAGQEEFAKLEQGDSENRELWQWFKKESLKEFSKIYQRLDVHFSVINGESDYEKELVPLVEMLKVQNLIAKSEGAYIFNLEQYGLPPALVQKSDGASLYLTRDIVGLQKRIEQYNPEKVLYVVANEQALPFQQLFAVAKLLGLDQSELVHVKFGLVLGSDRQKMATREGKVVPLEEVLNEAVSHARTVVEQKNSALSAQEKEAIAETVGIGALKYNDLRELRTSDIVFDWDRMLDLTGDSGPYLQYTYARLAAILAKAGWLHQVKSLLRRPNTKLLTGELELSLVKQMTDFSDILIRAIHADTTNGVALYLYHLAALSNRYYETTHILSDENTARKAARLMLIETVAAILKRGLALLGIRVLERI